MPKPTVVPAGVIQHCEPWVRDGYKSIQVNVDTRGCNILGDAANEPSIAVSFTDPRKIVIGWRQFDSVQSDFRQPGWAYSHDGGHTWVFRGSLDPGVFGTDPVLAAGPDGEIYYFSFNFDESRLFKSFDGGITWPQRTQVIRRPLDKSWMAVDQTNGPGRGNIYGMNRDFFFSSTDGGNRFDLWAGPFLLYPMLSVGPDGVLWAVDVYFDYILRSESVRIPGGLLWFLVRECCYCQEATTAAGAASPNPVGLLGQSWVAGAYTSHPLQALVYVLRHCEYSTGELDLKFYRSPDSGVTWSGPIRVNDDTINNGAWQWFEMMSVAPNGRIDVVWNDTRNYLDAPSVNLSEVYYAFSTDTGKTWSTNVPVSPVFDSYVGWPQQAKLGDYYHMVSDNLGVNVAYAATFNGEQDIYFLRIGPWDCNGNQIDDALDISEARSRDCNSNGVPDECEYRADFNGDGLTTLDDFATFQLNLTGPGVTIPNDCARLLDPDHDADIDLHDFYLITHVFVAP